MTPAKSRLVADMERGTRIEVVWEDAYASENSGDRKTAVTCYDLGYFDCLDGRGVKFWREIDEEGHFRWEMNVPTRSIVKVRRLGPPPRGAGKPSESA